MKRTRLFLAEVLNLSMLLSACGSAATPAAPTAQPLAATAGLESAPHFITFLRGHSEFSVAFSPDGKTLATGSLDNTIRLWDVSNPKVPVELGAPLKGHTEMVESVAFSPDGKSLASGSMDNTIILWDVANRQSPVQLGAPLSNHSVWADSVAFSPDGKTLSSCSSYDGTISLWDVSNLQMPVKLGKPLKGHIAVYSIAFSPDGRTLASGGNGTISLWDISNPKTPVQLVAQSTGHTNSTVHVAFSPDGKTLASGSYDTTITLWDVSNPQSPVQLGVPLKGHSDWVRSVAFSPDGKTLASGGCGEMGAVDASYWGCIQSEIILWNVSNRQSPVQLGAPLTYQTRYVDSVAFSPDGKTLASASGDIILWDVDPASWR